MIHKTKQIDAQLLKNLPDSIFMPPKDPYPDPYLETGEIAKNYESAIYNFVPDYKLLRLCGGNSLTIYSYWLSSDPQNGMKASIRFYFQDSPKKFRNMGYADLIQNNHWIYGYSYGEFLTEINRMAKESTGAYFNRKMGGVIDYFIKDTIVNYAQKRILAEQPYTPERLYDLIYDVTLMITEDFSKIMNETQLSDPMNLRYIQITPILEKIQFDMVNGIRRFNEEFGFNYQFQLKDGLDSNDQFSIMGGEDIDKYDNPSKARETAESLYYTRLNSLIGDVLYNSVILAQVGEPVGDTLMMSSSL